MKFFLAQRRKMRERERKREKEGKENAIEKRKSN